MNDSVFILGIIFTTIFYALLNVAWVGILIKSHHPWTGYKIILCLLFLPASVLYFVGSWLHKILSKEI